VRDAEGYLLRPDGTRYQRSVRMMMAKGRPPLGMEKEKTET